MKFLSFYVFDAAKAADVAAAGDKVANTPGTKLLAQYVCQGMPYPGLPFNSMVAVLISEAESNEAMAAVHYPITLAGATIHSVPILELPTGGAAAEEKKYRG